MKSKPKSGSILLPTLFLLLAVAGLLTALYLSKNKTTLGSRATAPAGSNLANPTIYPKPIIAFGNSAFHDSLGARDPWAIKDNGTTYLYYDCAEDLLNPSFESNWGTSGWNTTNAKIEATTEKALFGSQSLKITTNSWPVVYTPGSYATTGDFYYNGVADDAHLAMPAGLEVVPNTWYIASVYSWSAGSPRSLLIKQYRDDPKFPQNWISGGDRGNQIVGGSRGSQWDRLKFRFQTTPDAHVITISLYGDPNTVTYWDGLQLERAVDGQTEPSPFPADQNFNRSLEDTIGWRSCVATSTDGVNFQKKGPVQILGQKGAWENIEKPGWAGSSLTYISPFAYQGKWYSYTWENGYDFQNYLSLDSGSTYRRPHYGDLRGQVPNGIARSGLVVADSLLGPFTRISQSSPKTIVGDFPATDPRSCAQDTRREDSAWGCDYFATNGVPQKYGDKWLIFTDGVTGYYKDPKKGGGTLPSVNGACNGHFAITSGNSVGNSPLGPWTSTPFDPVYPAEDLCKYGISPETPTYYYDSLSKTHLLFNNKINWGEMKQVAFWNKNLSSGWSMANQQVIIDQDHIPWSSGTSINSSTLVNEGGKVRMYFGARAKYDPPNGWNSFLFHDIGTLTMDLPLLPVTPTTPKASYLIDQQVLNNNPRTVQFVTQYYDQNGTDKIGNVQLVVRNNPNWLVLPYYFQGMYAQNYTSGVNYPTGVYIWDPNTTSLRYGWGNTVAVGQTLGNAYVDFKVTEAKTVNANTLQVTWQVTFKSTYAPGSYNVYLWQTDKSNNQDSYTQPQTVFTNYSVNWYFIKAGNVVLP